MLRAIILCAALVLASCGGGVAGISPAPSATRPSSTTAGVSIAPSPTAMTSSKGFITVRQPLPGAHVKSPITIAGDASVFEGTLQWRVLDGTSLVLAEGVTTASAGAPGRGTFNVTATFTMPPLDANGAIEVYTRSMKDGSVDDIARIPVVLTH